MDFWSHRIIEGPETIANYDAPLGEIPLFVLVADDAVSRLYVPLLDQQIKGFEERVNFVLRGVKKTLLTKPGERLRAQLDAFMGEAPALTAAVDRAALNRLMRAIEAYKVFLKKGEADGSVPFHVALTLTERLDAMALSVSAIKVLR